jgi:hypothetical protein
MFVNSLQLVLPVSHTSGGVRQHYLVMGYSWWFVYKPATRHWRGRPEVLLNSFLERGFTYHLAQSNMAVEDKPFCGCPLLECF